jgi:hypothetical protein
MPSRANDYQQVLMTRRALREHTEIHFRRPGIEHRVIFAITRSVGDALAPVRSEPRFGVRPAVHLSFDRLDPVDVAFDWSRVLVQRECMRCDPESAIAA